MGSAVRAGQWLPEAVKFVESHAAELARVRTAFFSVHMMNTATDEKSRRAREAYTARVRALVRPDVEAFFTGRMKMSQLSFGERMVCRIFGAHDADLRNWPAIHGWGAGLFEPGA